MAMEKDIFACFRSPMYRNGKKLLIGIPEAERLQRAAVFNGFTTKGGLPRKRLSGLERLVILMREATCAADFNHEWWAAEASKPAWVQKLDAIFRRSWLYFPRRKSQLTAKNLGDRIGYELALAEKR